MSSVGVVQSQMKRWKVKEREEWREADKKKKRKCQMKHFGGKKENERRKKKREKQHFLFNKKWNGYLLKKYENECKKEKIFIKKISYVKRNPNEKYFICLNCRMTQWLEQRKKPISVWLIFVKHRPYFS